MPRESRKIRSVPSKYLSGELQNCYSAKKAQRPVPESSGAIRTIPALLTADRGDVVT